MKADEAHNVEAPLKKSDMQGFDFGGRSNGQRMKGLRFHAILSFKKL